MICIRNKILALFILSMVPLCSHSLDFPWGNKRYKIILKLKDGNNDTIFSSYNYDKNGKAFFYKDSTTRIYPEKTKNILLINEDGNRTKGIVKDSNWLFQVETGEKIVCYSPEPFSNNFENYYFQKKGSQKLYSYNKSKLKELFKDDDKAFRFLEKHFANRFAGYAMLIGGIAISPATILYYPIIIASIITSSSSFLFKKLARKNLLKGVRIYN